MVSKQGEEKQTVNILQKMQGKVHVNVQCMRDCFQDCLQFFGNLFKFGVPGLNVIVGRKNYKLQIEFRKLQSTLRISCRYCCIRFMLRDKDMVSFSSPVV